MPVGIPLAEAAIVAQGQGRRAMSSTIQTAYSATSLAGQIARMAGPGGAGTNSNGGGTDRLRRTDECRGRRADAGIGRGGGGGLGRLGRPPQRQLLGPPNSDPSSSSHGRGLRPAGARKDRNGQPRA